MLANNYSTKKVNDKQKFFVTLISLISYLFPTIHLFAVVYIHNLSDLQKIGNEPGYPLNGTYELTQNIDASATQDWNNGEGFQPIGNDNRPFTGRFNGKGYKIINLYINRPWQSNIGLFGFIGSEGEVLNLTLVDASVNGYYYVGGISGWNEGSIRNCDSKGNFFGSGYVGGLSGWNAGSIENCSAVGNVSTGYGWSAGGLLGGNGGMVATCYSFTQVSGGGNVGGLVGWNVGVITNNYSMGSISGGYYVGGLVGWSNATVSNCYSASTVSGIDFIGGLIGSNEGSVTDSYWDIQRSGVATSAGGIGKSTAEMKQQATFSNWDFTNIWAIIEGQTYPYFRNRTYSPLILINGPVYLDLVCREDAYEEYGAWAYDFPDGDLTQQIVIRGSVNTSLPGVYQIEYSVRDGDGNESSTKRKVRVIDIPPEITLKGPEIVYIECGESFVDPGAEAWDTCDNAYLSVIVEGFVDIYQSGVYELEYVALDSSNLESRVKREVVVRGCNVIPISTIEELQRIGNHPGYPLTGDYELTQNIDASVTINWNDGEGFATIGNYDSPFAGRFNGKGYTIRNLYINRSSQFYVSLFASVGKFGEVVNVNVENINVTGYYYVSGLVSSNEGRIKDCYASGTVTGNGYVGGLVATNNGSILNSYSLCNVTGSWSVGGLVGWNDDLVMNTYAVGRVTGGGYVGGIAGGNAGTIASSYARGAVSGEWDVGGLIGWSSGTVISSYWDIETSGQNASAGGVGKSTSEMKRRSTFENWDFLNIWGIVENFTYPYLKWQFRQSRVPNVIGKTQIEAEELLQTSGMTVGEITYSCSNLFSQGLIANQYPSAGEEVPPGTPVRLVISTGEPCIEGEGVTEGIPEGNEEGITEGIIEEGEVTEGEGQIQTEGTAEGEGIPEGEGQTEGEGAIDGELVIEGEGEEPLLIHTADRNGDNRIDLSELLRVIQFFNLGGYHCALEGEASEDGYIPGYDGVKNCRPHASDYKPQDWRINLSELLRLIQFFNMNGYYSCPGIGEDGFCPGQG